ncbi:MULTISPECIES: YybH family protein [Roseivirga]|jgi:ketosteroid isomerase-like protein|uniref:DUF4440 domain-containing protein n=1 Tax=Roseivirga spongicola TaxID=333140 RepID=A0A150XFP1_9BACT|nr:MULTISPECIES: nuclear transport factor 2 family protein [Roseivirga]KYG77507.1 DUF4440 domain-containing protein [Roseivirga spongicola]MBO6495523.1 nuclear transport factor 2 family protein [Roseivirga sp.]MBO6661695.1 nuclear transport factor 2 family protein [Roseivirga sp.]MBO6908320.1 nuclear transport factor 2 family protein [Roseivirga sp.]WPZ11215.1 nuclear transport factor 2 family protein [Roseivirga spongicola]
MKTKILILIALFTLGASMLNAQISNEVKAVEQVLKDYKKGLESLKITGLSDLFTTDSQIFESGGVEGTFVHYLEHHLGPELGQFKSFKFSDYKVETKLDLPYAFTTETYIYTIVLPEGDRTIKKSGVATSILKKENGEWKIMMTHTSSRNAK